MESTIFGFSTFYYLLPRRRPGWTILKPPRLSVTFRFRTVTWRRIALFPQDFAGTCTMSWGCAAWFLIFMGYYLNFFMNFWNIEKCPFTYYVAKWEVVSPDSKYLGLLTWELSGRWFPHIVDMNSGNLYSISPQFPCSDFLFSIIRIQKSHFISLSLPPKVKRVWLKIDKVHILILSEQWITIT